MLKDGEFRKVVASTLAEIRGVVPLAEEGILDEVCTISKHLFISPNWRLQCLYGLPVRPSSLPQLETLSQQIEIVLMIDNEQHVQLVEEFCRRQTPTRKPYRVFIKIDVGSHRAGVETKSSRLHELVRRAEASDCVEVAGFYCHAGHSYACRTQEGTEGVLRQEISGCLEAASLIHTQRPIIISVGSTPAAHVVQSLQATLPSHISLELHAGRFMSHSR